VLEHCRRRLSLAELPLGFGGTRAPGEGLLEGLLCEEGNDPARVLELFVDELSSSVLASDSPRYLAFIPAAPTKASLLFDMIVSCSSFPGTSWFEAAGAVAAENQALRLLGKQLADPDAEPEQLMVPFRLIPRGSTVATSSAPPR